MTAQRLRPVHSVLFLILAILACNLPGAASGTQAPVVDATKIALELQATQNALVHPPDVVDATKIALEIQATQNAIVPTVPVVDATKVALEVQATNAAVQLTQQASQNDQPQPPVDQPTAGDPAAPAQDLKARIKNAKILVY